MPIAQVTVVPLGTAGTSLSDTVAEVQRVLTRQGIKHELTPMCTILEGSLDEIFAALRAIHEAGFTAGSGRVMTSVNIDDRRDKPTTAAYKVDTVRKKLKS